MEGNKSKFASQNMELEESESDISHQLDKLPAPSPRHSQTHADPSPQPSQEQPPQNPAFL